MNDGPAKTTGSKLLTLEAARGIAAIIVVLHHFFLGFAPKVTGFLPVDRTARSLAGAWYFFAFNGDSAVYFFFVLSGFVLPISYLRRNDPAILYAAIFKRLPRLAGPVILAVCLPVLLTYFGVYIYANVADLTGSEWLRSAGYGGVPGGLQPNFLDAIRQGATTFLTGEVYYNSSIWTMKPEYIGSILVFAILPLCVSLPGIGMTISTLALCGVVSLFVFPSAAPFLVGIAISCMAHNRSIRVPWPVALGMIAIGLYCLGFVDSIDDYEWVRSVEWLWLWAAQSKLVLGTAGAALIVVALIGSPSADRILGGRFGYALGKLSFPIYLVHHPILMSLSCFALIWSLEGGLTGWTALYATLAATMVGVLVLAVPFAVADHYWVKGVNRVAKSATSALVSRARVTRPTPIAHTEVAVSATKEPAAAE